MGFAEAIRCLVIDAADGRCVISVPKMFGFSSFSGFPADRLSAVENPGLRNLKRLSKDPKCVWLELI